MSEHSRVERELHHLLKVTPGGQRDPFLKSKSCWPVPFQEDTFGEKRSTGKSVTGHGSLSSSGQLLGHVRLLGTPWTGAWQASLSITNSWSLLKLLSIESVIPSNHLILCRPLLLLPSIFPSARVSSNQVSSSHQVAKVLGVSASASVLPMNTQD